MKRLPLGSFLLATVVAHAADLPRPLASPDPKPAARPVVKAAHEISAQTTAKLAATTPKFSVRPARTTNTANTSVDLRDIDKPRNQIVRLPAYMMEPFYVDEDKLPRLKERDLLTLKGKLDLGFKRYPGLNFPGMFIPFLGNAGIALGMIEDDLAAERRKEMAELWDLYNISDDGKGAGVRVDSKLPTWKQEWVDQRGNSFGASRNSR